jgi:hypothetical protein
MVSFRFVFNLTTSPGIFLPDLQTGQQGSVGGLWFCVPPET